MRKQRSADTMTSLQLNCVNCLTMLATVSKPWPAIQNDITLCIATCISHDIVISKAFKEAGMFSLLVDDTALVIP